MKKLYTTTIIAIIIFMSYVQVYAQESFVNFTTTNQSYTVCQGGTIGVIASLTPRYENLTTFTWLENDAVREVRNEIAIVNTQTAGEKILTFSLKLNEETTLDTTITISVQPKPDVLLQFDGQKINTVVKSNFDIETCTWVRNGELLEVTQQSIKNPEQGKYRVVVTNSNGCRATSDEVVVK